MSLVLAASVVVAPGGVLRPGWLRVDGELVSAVGGGEPPEGGVVVDLGDAVLVPGFVDVHCHGGGGASFGEDADQAAAAARLHLGLGTTTLVASLVAAPRERLLREIDALAPLVHEGLLAGVHLEGPWLSAARCGAHDPRQLRPPAPDEVSALVSRDEVVLVTLAPELEGGLDAVRRVVDLGAVAAVGHTDADHATTRAAIGAGARHATHLFNAMPPVHHREPGPVVALLEDERVTLELVRDGVHLDPALCSWLDSSVEPHRLVAVTDAMAAAGAGDGAYRLGGVEVEVVGGVARTVGTGALAGSTATGDALFRQAAGDADDAGLLRASLQTATNPARVLGRSDLGRLDAGARADVVVLDPARLEVVAVMRSGAWVSGAADPGHVRAAGRDDGEASP